MAGEGPIWRALAALQLMTRIPVRLSCAPGPDLVAVAAPFFPVSGMIVGALSGAALLLGGLVLPGALPALLAVGVGIAVTGAMHEDGLADTVDGLGGGRSVEHRLAIMKDSRVGTYGVLALILVVMAKVAALWSLGASVPTGLALIAAHAGGRAASVAAMAAGRYAGHPDRAKLAPSASGPSRRGLIFAIATGLAPMFVLPPGRAMAALAVASLAALAPALAARRLIGGYTGDILGAVEQTFEAAFLVAASAM